MLGSALLAFPSLAAAAVPFRRDGTKFPPHQHPPTSGIKGAHLIASNPAAAAAATFIVSFSLCMFVYMEDKTIGANFLFLIDRKRRRNRGCSNSVRGLLPPTFYTVVIDTSSSLSFSLTVIESLIISIQSVPYVLSFSFSFFLLRKGSTRGRRGQQRSGRLADGRFTITILALFVNTEGTNRKRNFRSILST